MASLSFLWQIFTVAAELNAHMLDHMLTGVSDVFFNLNWDLRAF